MLRRDDAIRLQHMLDAAIEAVGYIEDRTRNDLERDRQLQHSLVRCLEIIGEAATRSSEDCQIEYPQIPWNDIVGMRNRLIHAYFDVNLNIVWKTVEQELPPLIVNLKAIL